MDTNAIWLKNGIDVIYWQNLQLHLEKLHRVIQYVCLRSDPRCYTFSTFSISLDALLLAMRHVVAMVDSSTRKLPASSL